MGFYPPAALVNDARRHGVEVRPVDVLASGWDATLEWDGDAPELAVEVVEDPESGYNAFITVDGMTLSAENVNGDNVNNNDIAFVDFVP